MGQLDPTWWSGTPGEGKQQLPCLLGTSLEQGPQHFCCILWSMSVTQPAQMGGEIDAIFETSMQSIYLTQGHISSPSQLVNPGLSHCNLSFTCSVPFLQASASAACSAGDLVLTPNSQIGLTSTYPSIRRHHFTQESFQSSKVLPHIPRVVSTSLIILPVICAYPLVSPVRTQACIPVTSAMPGTWQVLWGYLSSERIQ